ncbi:MAG: tryptophan synthase subunit alpha [Spirochaetes bacterium GWD1_27_9]|nr:MAG: tryptophan synthase subunit alpha [Spirochaetes bacterium GWB1_27_13]OHD21931.1 MAG: tryptophan synthase subunit alpha [Spirochaetes bacterium GWC1_27_15]OHD36561.1 MAG: tryptophan synthase subunit alpha [Spirochaetes bacterium GWD1_27_9]
MSSIENHINKRLQEKKILIMTHQVLGYPSFEVNYEIIKLFAKYKIDIVELQIPFSEPIADGPVFAKANQEAIKQGVKVKDCMDFAQKVAAEFDIKFVFMTYYNILIQYGLEDFIKKSKEIGITSLIVPDAYPENSMEFFDLSYKYDVAPIAIATPYTDDERFKFIDSLTRGLLYCVPRKGVTGIKTSFDYETLAFIDKCKTNSKHPIGVGFGVQSKEDIQNLTGHTDIAIIGSHLLKTLESGTLKEGLQKVEDFLASLNS